MKPHPPTTRSTSSHVVSKPLWMLTEWPPIKRSTRVSVCMHACIRSIRILQTLLVMHTPYRSNVRMTVVTVPIHTHAHSPVHDHHVPVPVCGDVWWRWSRYHHGVLRFSARLIWEETQQLPGTWRRGALLYVFITVWYLHVWHIYVLLLSHKLGKLALTRIIMLYVAC